MRNIVILVLLIPIIGLSQSNRFPSTGNVGIGVGSTPMEALQIGEAFTFHNGGDDYFSFRASYHDFGASGWNYLEDGKSAFSISGVENINFNIATGLGKNRGDFISWIRAITLKTNGNVGIGTITPTTKLDVEGNTRVNSLSIDSDTSPSSINGFSNRIELLNGKNGAIVFHPGQEDELMFGMHEDGNFYWGTGGSTALTPNYYAMYLNGSQGNLGLKGRLMAKEVKVDVDGWSDFVFEENYNLPTLEEVEIHIRQNGHLKNIPSAKEVVENGVNLGEMDAKLLQKIEELVLYAIDQQKEIEGLRSQIEELKKSI